MAEDTLKKYSVIGIFVIFGIAVFWHFLFDLAPCALTAAISPVNESLWEHTKLFFYPALIWYIIAYFAAGRHFPNFVFSHAIMLVLMPVAALLLHAFYRLFTQEHIVVLDIIITFAVIAAGSLAAYRLTVSHFGLAAPVFHIAALVIVVGLAVFFTLFTFIPPVHPLFTE